MHAPLGIADLTPDWLTGTLRRASGEAVVVAAEATPIGTGSVADCVRLELIWDRPTEAPVSLVAKVPSSSPASRDAAAAMRTYELEAAFYGELADSLSVCRPACFATAYDSGTEGYVVLLEDLAPAEPGDQLAGCGPDEAAAAIEELVALHTSRWNDPALATLAWLPHPEPLAAEFTATIVGSLFDGFLERYGDRLDPEVASLAARLMPRLGAYLADRREPWTLTHGDFRLDNLLFGGPRVAVLDWQTVKAGPALGDVAYFVGASLVTEDRRRYEEDLLHAYHQGIDPRMTWDDCWEQYRRYAFDGLVMAIGASMLVARTERSDAMFMAMTNRHGRHALDLDAESLLG